ncbi:uncharacterized protein LOC111354263 [Spodoptera litura]|uniref:Uncharacterized protein LOC111354263 n=1 Tax=Spodoptera litura TaxID=69820 RepID=A0A9J7IU53_SPOLT|nr:uncharacterized protein LOC111354263 [Spodoptera litura]
MKMIVKIAPTDETVRKSGLTDYLFHNEHIMYTEVLPRLVSLQKAAGVPEEEHLRYAKCYGSLNEAPNEVIILEDLKESGHIMLDKYEPLQHDAILNGTKSFAIFHSLSHVLKNKEPETFNELGSKLRHAWDLMCSSPEYIKSFAGLDDAVQSIVEDETHKKVVKNRISNMFKITAKLAKEENTKYSVIQHGDSWTNNILFKHVDSRVGPAVMIDYQASRKNNPMMDLLYFIFLCTDYETRSKHFYNWLDYYHSEFDKSLSYFGLRANDIYPRDQLDADVKKYGELVFSIALMASNLTERDVNETKELINNMEHSGIGELMATMGSTRMTGETLKRAKNRIEGLIATYTDFGMLDHFENFD